MPYKSECTRAVRERVPERVRAEDENLFFKVYMYFLKDIKKIKTETRDYRHEGGASV